MAHTQFSFQEILPAVDDVAFVDVVLVFVVGVSTVVAAVGIVVLRNKRLIIEIDQIMKYVHMNC